MIFLTFSGDKTVNDIWDKTIGIPGGGSDFVPFIQHAGIAVLNPDIKAADLQYDAIYHSNYDSYYWMSHFGDPDWIYHPGNHIKITFSYVSALANVVGLIAMRLTCSNVIPLDLSAYATAIAQNVAVLQQKAAPLPLGSLVDAANQ
jgi:N-acetylated-alpha-linked acidic dipeptidase